jgi:pimeloyl-ACP methyl ester carboxylesterase
MRRLSLAALAGVVSMAVAGTPTAAGATEVISIPTSFPVTNVNGSGAPCQSDGKPYVLHGEIVGPRAVLMGTAPATATLYLHEYSFDDFWHFQTVPGVDYASALAAAGHVSVTIDRLGYDDSPQPDGNGICLGAHADMAHQIVGQLRSGSYQPDGIAPRAFQHVVLAGHSVGAIIGELEAYSFHDVDALMFFGHTDGDYSPTVIQVGGRQGATCAQGGDGGPAPNYAFFGTPQESRDLAYHDADPAVIEAQAALRHRDPCGDVNSLTPTLGVNNSRAGEIKVPVLLLYGKNDATLASDAADRQSKAYTGSSDVSTASFDNAGHAFVLERVAPQVQATVSLWLTKHGFAPPASAPAPSTTPGPSPVSRAAPLLRLRGVKRRGCVRHALRLRVSVLTPGAPLRWARLDLDGRRILQTRRRRFSKRVSVAHLAPGLHRLVATARDVAGSSTRTVATFRRCR